MRSTIDSHCFNSISIAFRSIRSNNGSNPIIRAGSCQRKIYLYIYVDENEQIVHRRMVAGRGILRNRGRNIRQGSCWHHLKLATKSDKDASLSERYAHSPADRARSVSLSEQSDAAHCHLECVT